jgi:hypothetical protein
VVSKALEKTPVADLQNDCDAVRGILAALQGKNDEARWLLLKVLANDRTHAAAQAAFNILASAAMILYPPPPSAVSSPPGN